MPNRRSLLFWLQLAAPWLLVLLIAFVAEYAIMLALPKLLGGRYSWSLEALVDSFTLTSILAPVTWWAVVRPLRENLRLRASFLTDLFTRIEMDRRQTAYELHDGIGQSLSLLVVGLRSAHDSATDAELAARCGQLQTLASECLSDVKRLARGLRPSLLDDLGLAPALERLVADIRANHPIELSLRTTGLEGLRFPDNVETAAFRIVQEALANALAHAHAQRVSAAVGRSGDALRIEVADDGDGMELSNGKGGRAGHLGLTSMRERAMLLGGEFALESAPGQGTRVVASIPTGDTSGGKNSLDADR